MNAQQLVDKYLASRHQYAHVDLGKVQVTMESRRRVATPEVTVNWPGMGAMVAYEALAFAVDLTAAAALALGVERILAGWGGVDLWEETE